MNIKTYQDPEANKKKILWAMDKMVKTLVVGKYATKKRAEEIKQRLMAVPASEMVKVNIRKQEDIEAFVLKTIPEWSEEWLLER
jgi:hypothetical protein